MEIERHIKEIRQSDDLSYSGGGQLVEVRAEAEAETDRKLIDHDTMLRLVEECREEEERLSVMTDGETNDKINRQMEISQMQLQVYNRQERKLQDARESLVQAQEFYADKLKE